MFSSLNPRIPSGREQELEEELRSVRAELRNYKRQEMGIEPYDNSHCTSVGEHMQYEFEQLMVEAFTEQGKLDV